MAKKTHILLGCSIFALLPAAGFAAGTYYNYNGMPQRNYGSDNPFYAPSNNGGSRYGCQGVAGCKTKVEKKQTNQTTGHQQSKKTVQQEQRSGFSLNAGLSHQFAEWGFEMKTAGSKLHYDNLHWNVFDAGARYDFNAGNTPMFVHAGLQYGMQYGDSPMVDDDISNGGYELQDWNVDLNNDNVADVVWRQQGHAVSVGTSNGGDMMGIYAGVGFSDLWHIGSVRFTPSVGYRYLKYKLETKQNYGLSLDTVNNAENYCQTQGDETQCLPFLVFVDSSNRPLLGIIDGVDTDGDGYIDTLSYINVPGGASYVETENTYYYNQRGVSHSYEVEWAGPYLALDMDYAITPKDALNARLEFGLPKYKSVGDQPYRPDWQHPTSLEDEGGFGDAYHFGVGGNWLHSLSDSVLLTLGMTFDYYSISSADATTYLNSGYYIDNYYDPAVAENTKLLQTYGSQAFDTWGGADQSTYLSNLETIEAVEALDAAGWKQEKSGEIESIYKSLGVRLGIQAKF